MPFMRWVVLAVLLTAGPVSGQVSHVLRPDTRALLGVSLTNTALEQGLIRELFSSIPNENAACLYGTVQDTTVDGTRGPFVRVGRFVRALRDSATPHGVYPPRRGGAITACPDSQGLVGVVHTHLGDPFCTHSDNDAILLANDSRLLLAILMCDSGRGEILFQDGRRWPFMWRPPEQPGPPRS